MEFKIIVESLLTGSQFEITVGENDKILMLKSSIQKILGIPTSQQHLLLQQTELDDATVLKDIPIYEGIRLKLIPSMKVGPIQSARRVIPSLSDCNSWLEINDVMKNSKRDEPLTLKTKYLVYKSSKKNVHRWKLNGDKGKLATSTSSTGKYVKSGSSLFGSSFNGRDEDKIKKNTEQSIQENIRTTEKMNQLRLEMELASVRKKLKSISFSANKMKKITMEDGIEKPIDKANDKFIQKQLKQERYLSVESKMKLKENLSRNRSLKAIVSPSNLVSSLSLPFFRTEINHLEHHCFSESTGNVISSCNSSKKLGRSSSFQSNYAYNCDSNSYVNNAPIIQKYDRPLYKQEQTRETKVEESGFASDALKDFLTNSPSTETASVESRVFSRAKMDFSSPVTDKSRDCQHNKIVSVKKCTGAEINECMILPKLLVRDDAPLVFETTPFGFEEVRSKSSDFNGETCSYKKPSAESLIEYYDNLTSSSSSSLVSKLNDYGCFHQPTGRFYHSDLDLNQLNYRFKTKLSLSNQDINTSEGNLVADSGQSRSSYLLLSAIKHTKETTSCGSDTNTNFINMNYDKFLNDLLDGTLKGENNKDEVSMFRKEYTGKESEPIDLFNSDANSTHVYKSNARQIPTLKKSTKKLKSFGSNPILTATASNLTATATTSTNTVHIPQISRLDAIPTKYRRGYNNLNDACLSNANLSSPPKIPHLSEWKPIIKEHASFQHGSSIIHCRSKCRREFDMTGIDTSDPKHNDSTVCGSSGRQSRFEYSNGYFSNLSQYASSTHHRSSPKATSIAPSFEPDGSQENLFNMNFDSFYEDFSSAELSWSSTTSSASSTSFESSSVSSIYDKQCVILPDITLDHEIVDMKKSSSEKTLLLAVKEQDLEESQEKKEASGKLRCFQCNKKLGIIMIMRCHCGEYFCSSHRFAETHQCSYNYKKEGKKKLEHENPLCVTQKLPKI